jgi:archaellum component FlaF (FlaF/FlaG flagellin family)
MKTVILFFSILMLQGYKITVLDQNNEAIASANLKFYKNGIVVKSALTNEQGIYNFNFAYDSVNVHFLGFNDLTYINKKDENIKIRLSESKILLDEVSVNSSNKYKFLGDYKKKNGETRFISKQENQFAVLFKKNKNKETRINSLLLNIKKTPHLTDIVFNFYTVDSIQRKYKSYSKNSSHAILTELLPNSTKIITSIKYQLKPNQSKEIVEINLDSLNIEIPNDGIFIGIYTENIYNEDGIKIPISSALQLPEIYKHLTKENNYCVTVPLKEIYWQNINQVQKHGEKTDDVRALFGMLYYEPSIGLKVQEVENSK